MGLENRELYRKMWEAHSMVKDSDGGKENAYA